jgi:hypothetical protein
MLDPIAKQPGGGEARSLPSSPSVGASGAAAGSLGVGSPLDPAAGPVAPEVPRATLLASLRNLILLVLPIAVAISYLGRWAESGERDQLFEELIGDQGALPLGYLYAGGKALASEQRWLRLVPGPDSPESGEHGPLPTVVLIGRYGAALSAQRQFDLSGLPSGETLAKRVENFEKDGKSGFDGLLGRGTIAFGPYETDYVHLERYRPGEPPFELIRVNLTQGDQGQLLEAHFAPKLDAKPDALLPFLTTLRLNPAPAGS